MRRNGASLGTARKPGQCPFVPGFGGVPPYLAGRAVEQKAGLDCLHSIRVGNHRGHCLVLWGPRGNGKTSLLVWMKSVACELGIQVVVVDSADIETHEQLAGRISGPPKWLDWLGGIPRKSFQWKATLDETLARRLRKAPLALLIDEAHALDEATGRSILSATQRLGSEGAPLLVALAGTPGLPDHLGAMQKTFWERSEILPLNRLKAEDACDAIRVPFESAGRSVTPEALARVVAESHGYPFFLQLWGKLLWGSGGASTTASVTESDIQRVQAEFKAKQNQFYNLRFRELSRMHLVDEAAAVAEAYGNAQKLPLTEINRALETMLKRQSRPCDAETVSATVKNLEAVGYMWDPGDGPAGNFVQGIPSLMDFVLRSASNN